MRRPAAKLVVFLVLGAIVNVAVAWGCALSAYPTGKVQWRGQHISGLELDLWDISLFAKPGTSYLYSTRNYRIDLALTPLDSDWFFGPKYVQVTDIPRWSRFLELSRPGIEPQLHQVWHELAHGWPQRALYCAMEFGVRPQRYFDGIRLSPGKQLPLRPIWPGFAINTIFYAGVLWLLFATPGFVRRRVRHVRGRCLHCGYDLRGQPADSNKCPECGQSSPLPRGEGSGVRVQAECNSP